MSGSKVKVTETTFSGGGIPSNKLLSTFIYSHPSDTPTMGSGAKSHCYDVL